MTGIIAQEMGEVEFGSIHYRALFMVGITLFLISLMVNYLLHRQSAPTDTRTVTEPMNPEDKPKGNPFAKRFSRERVQGNHLRNFSETHDFLHPFCAWDSSFGTFYPRAHRKS